VKTGNKHYYCGVQQGNPISPLLATLCLTPHLTRLPLNHIMYADDGLLYGNQLSRGGAALDTLLTFLPESGIKINTNKSYVVRQWRNWQRPLKILGETYLPRGFHSEVLSGSNNVHEGGFIISSRRKHQGLQLKYLDAIERIANHNNSSINMDGKKLPTLVRNKVPRFPSTKFVQRDLRLVDNRTMFQSSI
jgi:hypothetical protein